MELRVNGHKDSIWHGVFTKDARHVFTCSKDATSILWDMTRKVPVRTFKGHESEVSLYVRSERCERSTFLNIHDHACTG